jgi:transcription antitermination factor NusG
MYLQNWLNAVGSSKNFDLPGADETVLGSKGEMRTLGICGCGEEWVVAHRAELCLYPDRAYVLLSCKDRKMKSLEMTDGKVEDTQVWWALYTRHQHEKVVAQNLLNKGFDVFLPVYDSIRRWKDRSKVLSLPLFPCYVFLRGGLNRRSLVVTTPGVHMILCSGEHVAVIPDNEIDAIRLAARGPALAEPHPYLKCGERVRVTRGSLAGVQGILIRKKSQFRLVLSVHMLAQSVSVEINAADVEPVLARSGMMIPTAGLNGAQPGHGLTA